MKSIAILLLSLSNCMFTSCNGQNTIQSAGNTRKTTTAIGDTVSTFGKSIIVIFQSRNNIYWFGTDGEGVYRYDSKTVVHFSTKDGLSHDRIRQIQEDKSGNIFFTTLGGICIFDGQKFTTLSVDSSNNEWNLAPGDMWFAGNQDENGPYRYDGKSLYHLQFPKHYMEDEFYKRLPNAPYNPYQVYTTYKDSKANIWLGTSTFGICRYDGKTLNWMYERHLSHIGEEGSFGIRSIIEDKKGKFWFCNTKYRYNIYPDEAKEEGMIKYTKEEGIELNAPDGNDRVYFPSVVEDNNGDLWMVTYSQGVWRYDGKEMKQYVVKDDAKEVALFCIYKDNRGALWLGTQQNGVYRFNGKTFERFKP